MTKEDKIISLIAALNLCEGELIPFQICKKMRELIAELNWYLKELKEA